MYITNIKESNLGLQTSGELRKRLQENVNSRSKIYIDQR